MRIIRQLSGMRTVRKPVCLAVGFFDGVHAGHQEILRRTIARARAIGGEAWAMTFDPHPLKILQPASAPPLLTCTAHKLDLIRRFGMEGCLLIPFTRPFSTLSGAAFLGRLGTSIPTLSHIFVGEDWRFGKNGQGDTQLLTDWAHTRGVQVSRVTLVHRHADPVSSTRIRTALSEGRLALVARLLGRPFSILGSVRRGNGIGRQIGFPTANLDPHNEARPPTGIYAVRALVNRRPYAGLVSFGIHPTVKPLREPLLELHLLEANMNLYGQTLEVFFFARIREERMFPSTEALVRQIRKDIGAAQRLLRAPDAQKLWNSTLQTWYPDTIVPPKRKRKCIKKGHRAETKYGSSS